MPEFIAPQDGAEKQDCERNAVKRWFDKHYARLAPLRPVYLGDDLFACKPIAAMVKDNGGDFIFTAKKIRTRRTTSSRAPRPFITPKKSARARRPRRSATAGSRPCRCATARTPCSSTGSASRSSMRAEAPFGEFPGTYGPRRMNRVLEIKAITRRRDPLYQNAFVAHPDNLLLSGLLRTT
jgi:hypothetical protein